MSTCILGNIQIISRHKTSFVHLLCVRGAKSPRAFSLTLWWPFHIYQWTLSVTWPQFGNCPSGAKQQNIPVRWLILNRLVHTGAALFLFFFNLFDSIRMKNLLNYWTGQQADLETECVAASTASCAPAISGGSLEGAGRGTHGGRWSWFAHHGRRERE